MYVTREKDYDCLWYCYLHQQQLVQVHRPNKHLFVYNAHIAFKFGSQSQCYVLTEQLFQSISLKPLTQSTFIYNNWKQNLMKIRILQGASATLDPSPKLCLWWKWYSMIFKLKNRIQHVKNIYYTHVIKICLY